MSQIRHLPRTSAFLAGFLVAAASMALATGVGVFLRAQEDTTVPLVYLVAIAFTAWYAGTRWALVCAVLSPFLAALFLLPPSGLEIGERADSIRLALLIVLALVTVAISALRERSDLRVVQSEQRLREAMDAVLEGESLFSNAFQSNPAAMSITRASDRRILEVNHSFLDILGYTREEVLGGAMDDADIWASSEERTAFTQKLSAEGGVQNMEVRLLTKSGEVRQVLGSATPVTIRGDLALLSVFYDVTEMRRSEDALRRAEADYESIFDNAVVGFYKTTADGRFLTANTALAHMLGYDSSEQLIEQVTDIGAQVHVDPRSREDFARQLGERGEIHGFEAQARRGDGSTVWIALTGRSETDQSGSTTFEGIVEDITARRRREDGQRFLLDAGAKLASTLEFEATVQCALDIAVPGLADFSVIDLVNDHGDITRIGVRHRDPAAEEALQEMGRRYPQRAESHPIRQAIASGRTVLIPLVDEDVLHSAAQDEDHYQLLRKVPAAASLFVPMRAHGRILGAITLSVTTPARRFEPWDVAVAEGLAQRVAFALDNARLFARSQEIQEELREANRAKDEFLSMVSHELRTPITTIRAGSRLLGGQRQLDDQTRTEILADIDQESERLQLIVENLLALGRAELGRPPEAEPVSVAATVNRIVSIARRLRPDREIAVNVPADLPLVSGVPLFAELVLRNLVDNALKYGGPGTPISIVAEVTDAEVSICVRDEGPGIAEEELELIFDRFYRAPGTARKAAGAGMGLSVCKRLCDIQGGRIWARNHPEGGLEMTFTLPVHRDDELSTGEVAANHATPSPHL
jgi:PAS domain S-box-containing protein